MIALHIGTGWQVEAILWAYVAIPVVGGSVLLFVIYRVLRTMLESSDAPPRQVPSYRIELSEPKASRCACCGGLSVRLTRFVERDGDAFAVYYAAYSNHREHNELAMLISLGEWAEGSVESDRVAFYCRVHPNERAYQVMLGDAADSPWSEAKIIGNKLSAEDARKHPWKATAFEVLDEALAKDRALRGFLDRVHCGDASVPLENSFEAPDDVFALGAEEKSRAKADRSFAVLDGSRFFVRCLLPLPVEQYGRWQVGLWIEVSQEDFRQIVSAWNDPQRYGRLAFSGRVANDVRTDMDLPVALGSVVELHVPEAGAPPEVKASPEQEIATLLSTTWARADFEQYALARHFL